jgi:micrococcal nuclease
VVFLVATPLSSHGGEVGNGHAFFLVNAVLLCYHGLMRRLNQKVSFLLFILLLLFLPLFSQANGPQSFTGKVVGISDGDTISVMRKGRAVEARLNGIDCPEIGQPHGERAKRYTSDLVFGKEVEVQVYGTDRYGRLVGEVILPGGINFNHELVAAGLVWWYRKYAPEDRILKALETGARTAKWGLWADSNPIPPWEWRKGQRTGHSK